MNQNKNLYKKGTAVREEIDRLSALRYPHEVSLTLLGKDGIGKLFLDVGAGSDGTLGQQLTSREVVYFALDGSKESLAAQYKAGNPTIHSDVHALGVVKECMHVVHERFVLQGLPRSERETIIREMARAATERLIFLEYDWRSFRGSRNVNRFAKFAIRVLRVRDADVFAGTALRVSVRKALRGLPWRVHPSRRFREGKKRISYREVLLVAEAIAYLLEETGDETDRADLGHIVGRLKKEAAQTHPRKFRPPDVVTVCASSSRYHTPKRFSKNQ